MSIKVLNVILLKALNVLMVNEVLIKCVDEGVPLTLFYECSYIRLITTVNFLP